MSTPFKPVGMEKGRWQVVRNCCSSGLCFTCQGSVKRPMRIVHATGYSERYAKTVAANWRDYKASAEPMPDDFSNLSLEGET